MYGLDPEGLSQELEEAFDRRRAELANRLDKLVKEDDTVLFAGELMTLERAQTRFRKIRWNQGRALLEVIALYAVMGIGAWFLFKLVAAYCR